LQDWMQRCIVISWARLSHKYRAKPNFVYSCGRDTLRGSKSADAIGAQDAILL